MTSVRNGAACLLLCVKGPTWPVCDNRQKNNASMLTHPARRKVGSAFFVVLFGLARTPAAAAAAYSAVLAATCLHGSGSAVSHARRCYHIALSPSVNLSLSMYLGCARDDSGNAGPFSVERLEMGLPFLCTNKCPAKCRPSCWCQTVGGSRRGGWHVADTPSPFSGCFNRDGEAI